ncbi:hypothetical protein CspeluHIS016_0701090 [Cutaneotrichosporon spelunceum]|uniref:Uncharacterized protein n=1 Tax=Cutaneotrichosporon spelunceum TaxID=1672016 RepID=A0AAD3YEJ6_9TREE|nr:hypothetical protein CspeluHIS016_0701090 [Cutaneotrichosporon spelunceum]
MQFASTRAPTLTPLGQRLLALSRAKLHSLGAAPGSRDPTDGLRRGVLVREAVRSAWASLETPTAHHELTSWRAPALDVLSEEDEYDDDEREEIWLENQLSNVSVTDDDDDEFTVSAPVYDEYEFDATESCTISYNNAVGSSGIGVTVIDVSEDDDDDDMVESWLETRYDESKLVRAEELEVEAKLGSEPRELEVDSNSSSDMSDDEVVTPPVSPVTVLELSPALAALPTYAFPPATSLPRLDTKPLPDVEPPTRGYRPTLHRRDAQPRRRAIQQVDLDDLDDAYMSQEDLDDTCECTRFGLVCDSTCAPPPLSDCEEEEDDECRTPPLCTLDCSDLEVTCLASFDWKVADRIAKPQFAQEDGGDLALGLFDCDLGRRIVV